MAHQSVNTICSHAKSDHRSILVGGGVIGRWYGPAPRRHCNWRSCCWTFPFSATHSLVSRGSGSWSLYQQTAIPTTNVNHSTSRIVKRKMATNPHVLALVG